MKQRIILTICLGVLVTSALGQNINYDKEKQLVLQRNKIGKTYIFDRSKKGHYNRNELTYLGKLKTDDGRVFKVITSTMFWGRSPGATGRVLLYNTKNQYVGKYFLGGMDCLPSRITNNSLVFDNKERVDCDPELETRIPFDKGMPQEIFLPCKNTKGESYAFSE